MQYERVLTSAKEASQIMSVGKEVDHPQGTRRPLVPKQMDIRVGQYAEKNDLSKKQAYTEIIDFVIDGEGRVKRENVIKE